MSIKIETLIHVLSEQFKKAIASTDYEAVPLQGGTLGSVSLVTGIAVTVDGEKLPYKVVQKIQGKWERYSDLDSWRREYDLYLSNFAHLFSSELRWPICYYAEINAEETEFELWLEYIEGVTGLELTSNHYVQAATELGRLQGRIYKSQPNILVDLNNLSSVDLMKKTYFHYRSWPVVYDYIRSEDCAFPENIRQMIIDLDDNADDILSKIETLPVVLCHRDFWVNNLIYTNGKIALIDWDTAGWGYMGEDLASLIADEADIDHMVTHYKACVSAYYKGFSEYADVPPIVNNYVYEMILLIFGYRFVEWFLHTDDDEQKSNYIQTLQKIYEIKSSPL